MMTGCSVRATAVRVCGVVAMVVASSFGAGSAGAQSSCPAPNPLRYNEVQQKSDPQRVPERGGATRPARLSSRAELHDDETYSQNFDGSLAANQRAAFIAPSDQWRRLMDRNYRPPGHILFHTEVGDTNDNIRKIRENFPEMIRRTQANPPGRHSSRWPATPLTSTSTRRAA
jgi:hypothetical protein